MQWVLCSYLMVQLLALLALVICRRALRRLPDGGWCAAKSLGVLFTGLLLWLGTSAGFLRNEPGGAALAVLALAAAAVARGRGISGRRALAWARRRLPLLLAAELLFLLAFTGWAMLRAHDPAARHTEQPMDLLMLVAVSESREYPPLDPWLAGEPVSYYYLGYWLVATLGHLTATPPSVAYNVAQACWFALLLVTCFGLVADVLALGRRGGRGGAIAGGVVAAMAVGVVGNLYSAAEWGRALWSGADLDRGPWWWWRASRPFQDLDLQGRPLEVIAEFPFFSYLLGDLHPHLLAMPFLAAVATVALAVVLADGACDGAAGFSHRGSSFLPRPAVAEPGMWLMIAVSGPLLAINSWDYPAAWLLLVGAAAARGRDDLPARVLAALRLGGLLFLGALALCLPHLLTASNQVRGLLPNLFHPTPPADLVVVFGAFLPGLALLLALAWRQGQAPPRPALKAAGTAFAAAALVLLLGAVWAGASEGGKAWLAITAGGAEAPLSLALARWAAGWPSLLLFAGGGACAAAALGRSRRDGPAGTRFLLLLAATGLVIAGIPETTFVHDLFGTRMNTLFKLHYQAWLLLALAAAGATAAAWLRGGAFRAGAVVSLVVLGCGLLYPAEALPAKLAQAAPPTPSLDALEHLRVTAPDELAAIRWLRRHTRPDDVVLQAAGDSYRPEQARVSAATGRATLLGWRGHQLQWRGARFAELAAGREEALRAVYRGEEETLRHAVERWRVDYVFVGPVERATYGVTEVEEARLARVMELAFSKGTVLVFRRRG